MTGVEILVWILDVSRWAIVGALCGFGWSSFRDLYARSRVLEERFDELGDQHKAFVDLQVRFNADLLSKREKK